MAAAVRYIALYKLMELNADLTQSSFFPTF